MSVRKEGDEKVLRGLGRIKSGAGNAIKKVMGVFRNEEPQRLRGMAYPAARGDYSRTQQLASGWMAEGQGFEVQVTNRTPYSHWVVDEDLQAWMHKGRWWVAQDVVKTNAFEVLPEEIKDGVMGLYE